MSKVHRPVGTLTDPGYYLIMNQQDSDRRRYPRVFFSPGDGVCGTFSFPTLGIESLNANISDLSLGGLFFSVNRNYGFHLDLDTPATLTEITTSLSFQLKTRINLTVRRIQDFDILEVIGFGCEFTGIPEEDEEKLARFIQWAIDDGRNHQKS